ncbi:dihydropteroate synthase [Chitinolyticbacter albus]|uniref:dihydropteroate synthase n=1 Tax=Chitinolyticbacter albus TaxID=2961951 RepID=UPI00210E16F2|nr:dihydropteroate synthase [Chitinolyticbacter albus]
MYALQCGRFTLPLDRPLIMGVVNVTPDSFSDGGRYDSVAKAVSHAERLIADGADLLDIGGESTRPGAALVSQDEEVGRVVPVLAALQSLNVPLSVDTRRPAVMRAALEVGIDLINDVSALEGEGALAMVAKSAAAVCLMHKQGEPQTMQRIPAYADVVGEVVAYLAARRDAALAAGINRERLLLDPGFGFGKTLEHNAALFHALPDLIGQLQCAVLVGVSRKTMLGQITGRQVDERMPASIAAALMAAAAGAHIVRVHDVRETKDALAVWSALK